MDPQAEVLWAVCNGGPCDGQLVGTDAEPGKVISVIRTDLDQTEVVSYRLTKQVVPSEQGPAWVAFPITVSK